MSTLRENWKERFEALKGTDDVRYVIRKTYLKLGDMAISEMWETIENFISEVEQEAEKRGYLLGIKDAKTMVECSCIGTKIPIQMINYGIDTLKEKPLSLTK